MNKKETLTIVLWVLLVTASSYFAGKIAGNEAKKAIYLDQVAKGIEEILQNACPSANTYSFMDTSTTTEKIMKCTNEDWKSLKFNK